jgi:hypothetical protein
MTGNGLVISHDATPSWVLALAISDISAIESTCSIAKTIKNLSCCRAMPAIKPVLKPELNGGGWVYLLSKAASEFVARMIFSFHAKARYQNNFFDLEEGVWQSHADQGFN